MLAGLVVVFPELRMYNSTTSDATMPMTTVPSTLKIPP